MKRGMAAAFVIGMVLGMTGCSAETPEVVVTRDQYGADWPWPQFDRGVLSCNADMVLLKLGNVTYGLNGHAQSKGGYPDSRQLMAREPGTADISADGRGIVQLGASHDLIQLGLRLCQARGKDA